MSDIKEEPDEITTPAPTTAPVKEKKKAAPIKKKVKEAAVAEPVVEAKTEAEAPKKKVTKKKAAAVEDSDTKEPGAAVAKAPKATRAPTDFNLFMKYQLEVLGKENPEMKHKDKFSKAAAQWKELDEDEKKTILVKAKAAAAA